MASLGHVAIGVAAGRLFCGRSEIAGVGAGARASTRDLAKAMVAFSVASLLPDADALGFPLGISYDAPFGHRGATHSFAFAVLVGVIVRISSGFDKSPRPMRSALFTTLVIATHGVLDAMTDGGRGIALFFPFTTHRYFLPWRPIPVAPIGRGLISTHEGIHVLTFELVAFLPFLIYAFLPRFWRKRAQQAGR